jgi:hypothetical protein
MLCDKKIMGNNKNFSIKAPGRQDGAQKIIIQYNWAVMNFSFDKPQITIIIFLMSPFYNHVI